MKKDVFGQEIKVGDYLLVDGGGNAHAQYGLILKKVFKVTPMKVHTYYHKFDFHKNEFRKVNSVLSNTNKTVVIQPPPRAIEVFENPEQNERLIRDWVHGSETFVFE